MEMTKTEKELTMSITEDELKKIVAEYLSIKNPYKFSPKKVKIHSCPINCNGFVATAKGVLK